MYYLFLALYLCLIRHYSYQTLIV